MKPLLGTFVEIVLDAGSATTRAFDCAFGAIEQVARSMSFQDPASELSQLNANPGRFVKLSPLCVRVLRAGRGLSIASAGLFNYTIGGALVRAGALPDHGGGTVLDQGTWRDVEIRAGEARLRRPVRITLDGIAKGYALDRATRALRAAGVSAGWINAGGDVRAFGSITVPIARREADGQLRTLGGLRESAIATSVVGESPDQRFPSRIVGTHDTQAACGAWTVLAHHAWKADALTKVAALAPEATREQLIRRLGGRLFILRESDDPLASSSHGRRCHSFGAWSIVPPTESLH